jgi:hypothetical protein
MRKMGDRYCVNADGISITSLFCDRKTGLCYKNSKNFSKIFRKFFQTPFGKIFSIPNKSHGRDHRRIKSCFTSIPPQFPIDHCRNPAPRIPYYIVQIRPLTKTCYGSLTRHGSGYLYLVTLNQLKISSDDIQRSIVRKSQSQKPPTARCRPVPTIFPVFRSKCEQIRSLEWMETAYPWQSGVKMGR